MSAYETAMSNFKSLCENPYPGRGIILGRNKSGSRLLQMYWIMGRSENSKNRILVTEGSELRTELADPSKVGDSSLTIYQAMGESYGRHIVSNGDHTTTVLNSCSKGGFSLSSALSSTGYEPDLNATPRITGICSTSHQESKFELSLLRKAEVPHKDCERFYYQYSDIASGFGRCITTYTGDGNPLPPFVGEPKLMPLWFEDDSRSLIEIYWSALNVANRVAIAVKEISTNLGQSHISIINARTKVAPLPPKVVVS